MVRYLRASFDAVFRGIRVLCLGACRPVLNLRNGSKVRKFVAKELCANAGAVIVLRINQRKISKQRRRNNVRPPQIARCIAPT